MIVTRGSIIIEKYLSWRSEKCNCDKCGLENGWRKIRSWKMGRRGIGERRKEADEREQRKGMTCFSRVVGLIER